MSSFSPTKIIFKIVEAFQNCGHPITLDELMIEVNNLLDAHFTVDMIKRSFLQPNPGLFRLLLDGRWALSEWPDETEEEFPQITAPDKDSSDGQPIYTRPIPFTPNQAFDHIKESVAQFLETSYKLSNPILYAERGKIL